MVPHEEQWERLLIDLKAYASRRLQEQGLDAPGRRRWSRHGSTKYLWTPEHLEAAIRSVVEEQGVPLAVGENVERAVPEDGGAMGDSRLVSGDRVGPLPDGRSSDPLASDRRP